MREQLNQAALDGDVADIAQNRVIAVNESLAEATRASALAARESAGQAKRAASIQDEVSRAKISFIGIEALGGVAVGKDMKLRLAYQNTGGTTANDLRYNIEVFRDSSPKGLNRLKYLCDSVEKSQPGIVVYSNPGRQNFISTAIPGQVVTDAVVSGQETVVVRGCFAYATGGNQIHHDAFCAFAIEAGKASVPNMTNFCPGGSYSD